MNLTGKQSDALTKIVAHVRYEGQTALRRFAHGVDMAERSRRTTDQEERARCRRIALRAFFDAAGAYKAATAASICWVAFLEMVNAAPAEQQAAADAQGRYAMESARATDNYSDLSWDGWTGHLRWSGLHPEQSNPREAAVIMERQQAEAELRVLQAQRRGQAVPA